MSTPLPDGGATIVPEDLKTIDPSDTCWVEVTAKDGTVTKQNLKHNWHWVWSGGVMTDTIKCGACNLTRRNVQ